MAAVELHVNATYYAQHPELKSVYGKSQSVIGILKLTLESWHKWLLRNWSRLLNWKGPGT